MDLLTKARRLESRIARTVDHAAHRAAGSAPRDPLAIVHAVVEVVEQEMQPAGRGRRVFPYNSITVLLAAPSAAERARYEAVLECGPTMRERILNSLRAAGADLSNLEVKTVYAPEAQAGWTAPDFHVELARVTAPVEIAAPEPAPHPIELTVVHGTAEEPAYVLALARIDLGRGREVRDTRNQLVRANHIVFSDGSEGINTTVSRRHAHITWDPASRAYRMHDDGSAHGTHVLRNGSTIVVRTGSRGIRLREGDEVVLGEARVRVSVGHERSAGALRRSEHLAETPDLRRFLKP